jgi:hypothetical protein
MDWNQLYVSMFVYPSGLMWIVWIKSVSLSIVAVNIKQIIAISLVGQRSTIVCITITITIINIINFINIIISYHVGVGLLKFIGRTVPCIFSYFFRRILFVHADECGRFHWDCRLIQLAFTDDQLGRRMVVKQIQKYPFKKFLHHACFQEILKPICCCVSYYIRVG